MHSFGTKSTIDKKTISNIPIPSKGKVLGICIGTGDIAISIAKQYQGVKVIGLDASENMMNIAMKKANGLKNLEFMVGNAVKLPFEDNNFATREWLLILILRLSALDLEISPT